LVSEVVGNTHEGVYKTNINQPDGDIGIYIYIIYILYIYILYIYYIYIYIIYNIYIIYILYILYIYIYIFRNIYIYIYMYIVHIYIYRISIKIIYPIYDTGLSLTVVELRVPLVKWCLRDHPKLEAFRLWFCLKIAGFV